MNITKQSLTLLTLSLSLTVAAIPAWSQTSHPGASNGHSMGHMGRGQGGMNRMSQQLNLTPQQQARVKKIMDATMSQARTVRGSTSLQPAQKRAKMMQLMKTMHTQLDAILTPAQRKTVTAMRQQHMKQMQGMSPAPGTNR